MKIIIGLFKQKIKGEQSFHEKNADNGSRWRYMLADVNSLL
jgi:hypothetical protein